MINVEYFKVSVQSPKVGAIIPLIDFIDNFVEKSKIPFGKSIKVIGLEEDITSPRLILFDLVDEKPYKRESNIFTIRINESNFELITEEEEHFNLSRDTLFEIIKLELTNLNIKHVFSDEHENISVKPDLQVNKGLREKYGGSNEANLVVNRRVAAMENSNRALTKIINRIFARRRYPFRVSHLEIDKNIVYASDSKGNKARFYLEERDGRMTLKNNKDHSDFKGYKGPRGRRRRRGHRGHKDTENNNPTLRRNFKHRIY